MNLIARYALLAFPLTACSGQSQSQSPPLSPPPPSTVMASMPPAPSVAPPTSQAQDTRPAPTSSAPLIAKPLALPGASGPAFLDLIAYERAGARVWVPVGSTGSVDVLDTRTATFTRIDGFKTVQREAHGKMRTFGPSAAAVGDGFVYVGNRATNEVCAVDAKAMKLGKCAPVNAPIDVVAYVASSKEVWVSTPKDKAWVIFDATKAENLKKKTTVITEGEPECSAVDEARGLFFTNLEDAGKTVVIDIKTHKVVATWNPQCGQDGPRGVAYDRVHNFAIVACTDHVQVLDAGKGGALLGKLDTGAGVDNIDFVGGKVYAAAGKAAKLTIANIDDAGQLTQIASALTSEGARNAVADAKGNVYVADSPGARVLLFSAQ